MARCFLCAFEKKDGGCMVFPPKPIPQGECSMMTYKDCYICRRNGDCPPERRQGDYCSDLPSFLISERARQLAVWVR